MVELVSFRPYKSLNHKIGNIIFRTSPLFHSLMMYFLWDEAKTIWKYTCVFYVDLVSSEHFSLPVRINKERVTAQQ
jgi:hypothetical protein